MTDDIEQVEVLVPEDKVVVEVQPTESSFSKELRDLEVHINALEDSTCSNCQRFVTRVREMFSALKAKL